GMHLFMGNKKRRTSKLPMGEGAPTDAVVRDPRLTAVGVLRWNLWGVLQGPCQVFARHAICAGADSIHLGEIAAQRWRISDLSIAARCCNGSRENGPPVPVLHRAGAVGAQV